MGPSNKTCADLQCALLSPPQDNLVEYNRIITPELALVDEQQVACHHIMQMIALRDKWLFVAQMSGDAIMVSMRSSGFRTSFPVCVAVVPRLNFPVCVALVSRLASTVAGLACVNQKVAGRLLKV